MNYCITVSLHSLVYNKGKCIIKRIYSVYSFLLSLFFTHMHQRFVTTRVRNDEGEVKCMNEMCE